MKFPLPPASVDPPRDVCEVGRTNMVPNMKSIELKTPVTNLYTMSSGSMDLCTFCGI